MILKKFVANVMVLSTICLSHSYAAENVVKPVPNKNLAAPDYRKGLPAKELLNPSQLTSYDAQQTTGEIPLYNELFKPTLQEWIKAKGKLKADSSGLIYEKDYRVEQPTQFIQDVPTLIEKQYFYRQSLHAELVGANAKSIIAFTHSKNGKVFVSTRFNKIYDPKEFIDEMENKKEFSQCVDISARITVTNVPMKNNFGVQTLVDYWQDFEVPVCHTNSDES
jgi:hypothetical protein